MSAETAPAVIIDLSDLAALVDFITNNREEPGILISRETLTQVLIGSHSPRTRKTLETAGWTILEAADRTKALSIVARLRSTHVAAYNQVMFNLGSDDTLTTFEAVEKTGHDFTPEGLAALFSIAHAPLIGSTFAVASRDPGAQLDPSPDAGSLMNSQLKELAFAAWLITLLSDEVPLSEILRTRISPRSVSQETVRWALEGIQFLTGAGELPRFSRYLLLALGAYLARESGANFVGADEWATLWLERELEHLDEKGGLQHTEKARIDTDLAQRLLDRTSLLAAINVIGTRDLKQLAELPRILSRIGAEDLTSEYLDGIHLPKPTSWSREDITEKWLELTPDTALEVSLIVAKMLIRSVPRDMAVEIIWALGDAALSRFGRTRRNQAITESWAGIQLKERDFAREFLARVGDRPRPWESSLDFDLRFELWAERSNALRLEHRLTEAKGILEDLGQELEGRSTNLSEEQDFLIRRNLSIILRDLGQREMALELLERLVEESPERFRAAAIRSLGVSYTSLGRHQDAAAIAERGWRSAKHSSANRGPARLMLATARASAGDFEGASSLFESATDEELDQISLLIGYCAMALSLESNDRYRGSFDRAWSRLDALLGGTSSDQIEPLPLGHLLELDALRHTLRDSDPKLRKLAWERVNEWSISVRGYESPEALIGLAEVELRLSADAPIRAILDRVPMALTAHFQHTRDVGAVASSTSHLRLVLTLLRRAGLELQLGLEQSRVIAELRRDAIGRAVGSADRRPVLPWDDVLGSIERPLVVLECEDLEGQELRLVATSVSRGEITTFGIPMPIDLRVLSMLLQRRLQYWTPDLPGDPFEFDEWTSLERLVSSFLDGIGVDEGAKVVVIEHEQTSSIPWHVILAPRFPVSYSASWSDVMSARKVSPRRFGSCIIGRKDESPRVITALSDASKRFGRFGGQCSLSGEAATRSAVTNLLQSVDLAILMCHGEPDASGTMAWLIADQHGLPDRSRARRTQQQLFGSKECELLQTAPSVVLSAACSSGVSRHEGVGELIGLYGALRRRGTDTFISPRWNVPAEPMAPLLEALAELVLAGYSPVDAARIVCLNATNHNPRWIAWCLAVQGSWR